MTLSRPLYAALLATLALACLPAVAQNFDKAEIKTEKLSPSTYVMYGAGGNLGVSVGDDAVFVIDDQYAPMTPKIIAAIKTLTDKPVQFVLNTHWHGDHTGGNENLGKAGTLIVAHENVRKRLSGDTFFNGFYPFIDNSSGGTPDGVIAAADRALALADDRTRIIPGHGPVCGKSDLKVYRDMLATVNGRVKALMKDGKTREEIVAAKPSAEFDEKWGKAFINPGRFIEMLVVAQTPAPATNPTAK